MLTLPIYLRGSSYCLHTRIAGKQFKRSLQTNDRKTAISRGIRLLELIVSYKNHRPKVSDFDLSNLSGIRKYEVDLSRGILRADGPEDHQQLLEALQALQGLPVAVSNPSVPSIEEVPTPKKGKVKEGLTLPEVLEKLFLVKAHLSQATILSYRKAVNECSAYLKHPLISDVHKIDITKYQEYLASNKNTARTIDNKISVVGTIFNFAIKQGYMFTDNPAKERKLQSNKERARSGYAIFDRSEIKQIFESDFLKTAKEKDPDYYWALVLGLITGCRISEITSLTVEQFKRTESGICFIRISDSKTQAGEREIPISDRLLNKGLADFIKDKEDKIFRYNLRLGKGSGNAVGKKFKRHLEELNIKRPKLVFHSLRKFCNNYLKEKGVSYEARCQYIGHEVEDINNTVYSEKFKIERLEELVSSSILGLEVMAGFLPTKFVKQEDGKMKAM